MTALRLIVDNSQGAIRKETLLNKAVQAYWEAVQDHEAAHGRGETEAEPPDHEGGMRFDRKDAAIEFLVPLRTRSPQGLVQKVQILKNMVETERSPELIAEFAASIADDALSMSRQYLSRAI